MSKSSIRADLQRYPQLSREAVLWKLEGLSPDESPRPLVPTGTNLIGLVKHLAGVEAGFSARPYPAICEVEYVRFWLWFVTSAISDAAPTSAHKNINLAILRDLVVPVPRLEKQTLFAERVAAAVKIWSNQETPLQMLDELFASLQHRAFTGELSATHIRPRHPTACPHSHAGKIS